ncbi:hypothetical protein JCM10599A_08180 [Paraburkholderia kururiensis]
MRRAAREADCGSGKRSGYGGKRGRKCRAATYCGHGLGGAVECETQRIGSEVQSGQTRLAMLRGPTGLRRVRAACRMALARLRGS